MSKIYFTLTGTKYYYGKDFLKPGMEIRLEKDPDNEYDKEAIKVIMAPLGQIGSVANSPYTVLGDCMSAGRIYDKIGKKAKAKIMVITDPTPGSKPGNQTVDKTTSNKDATVQTGDVAPIAIFVVLLVFSAGTVVVIISKRKKK